MAQARARKIKLVLFDVDGVLTDGTIWLFPAPSGVTSTHIHSKKSERSSVGGTAFDTNIMIEAKGFNAHDGTAISLARYGGLKTGLITKRISETVMLRARDLRLDHVHQGIADKLTTFRNVLKHEGLHASEAAYIGDDIIDLPVMRHCGFAVAVANAREEVKDEAHLITDRRGGEGALRDVVEYILRVQGKLDKAVARYLAERNPKSHKSRR